MPWPKGLPLDTHVIFVRRGEDMVCMLPVSKLSMTTQRVMPPEIALEAARTFLAIQENNPGRASMPIVSGDKPFGLAKLGSDYVFDPQAPLWVQLEGEWEERTIPIISPEDGQVVNATMPCVTLILDDIER